MEENSQYVLTCVLRCFHIHAYSILDRFSVFIYWLLTSLIQYSLHFHIAINIDPKIVQRLRRWNVFFNI